MSTLSEAVAFVGGSAVLIGAIAWVIRSALSHGLSRDLEAHKARLQSESTLELERLRHELRLLESENVKRSQLLVEKRAELIAELYSKLVDFLGAAESFASPAEWSGEPSKKEKAAALGEKAAAFMDFFQRHRIYFGESICEGLNNLFHTVHGPAIRYRVWLRMVEDGNSPGGKLMDSWDEAWNAIQRDVPPLMKTIETEFRRLLGVN